MNKTCVFDCISGYTSVMRIGKIYTVPVSHYNFLMNNHDVIDLSYWFSHLKRRWKEKFKLKIFPIFEHVRNRELGDMLSIAQLMDKYYHTYFYIIRGPAGNRTPNHLHPKQVSYH